MKNKVQEQKGKIVPNRQTYRSMTYSQKVHEKMEEMDMLRRNQMMEVFEQPKQ